MRTAVCLRSALVLCGDVEEAVVQQVVHQLQRGRRHTTLHPLTAPTRKNTRE
jgi:hypothetical protein